MKASTFFIAVLACVLLMLAGTAGVVAWADPLLASGALEEGGTALFVNERYEMAGLIRYQDYEDIVMGTSLVANYRASWFTQATGRETLKVTFPDGRLSEFDIALDLAFRTHGTLNTVYFCLDPNILIREDRSVELPEYLYNDNPVDDLQLYLNGESLALAVKSMLQGDGGKVTLDEAYVWDGTVFFAKATVLWGYNRPEAGGAVLPPDACLDAADGNLAAVCRWVREHPDVTFVIWFPPYSVLYWDTMTRKGEDRARIAAVEHAALTLLEYDNVKLHCFLDAFDVITDLDNYHDYIHCSAEVTAWAARNLLEGGWELTRENCRERLDALRRFAAEYDYDAIFEEEG